MTTTVTGAADGARRIRWAARRMPVLREVAERIRTAGTLHGLRVGVCLVLEPKTANLALALRDAGAAVSVHCAARSTDQATADALAAEGVTVFAEATADDARETELARAFLRTEPDILIDDGAEIIRLAHREFPELVARMRGAAEETTSGVRPLRAMHDDGALRLPVIAVNDAATKYLFDNVYGTAQSCVMALLDITNLQLAGRTVLVIGYGWVGRGVARHAAALGGRVVVAELDAIKALQAWHDGHRVHSVAEAAPEAEVVFAATGIAGVVTPEHLELFGDDTVLCTAGGGSFELPMDHLHGLGTRRSVREAVDEYTLASGRRLLVVSDGECLNCTDAEGNPIEVMDLSLALQASAVERLAGPERPTEPGLYPIPAETESDVAAVRLRHEGASLEPLTDRLRAALRQW